MQDNTLLQRRGSKEDLITAGIAIGEIVFALDTHEHGWIANGQIVWRNLDDLLTGEREPDSTIGSDRDEYIQYPQLPKEYTETYKIYCTDGFYVSKGLSLFQGDELLAGHAEKGSCTPTMYHDFALGMDVDNIDEIAEQVDLAIFLLITPGDHNQFISKFKILNSNGELPLEYDLTHTYDKLSFGTMELTLLEGFPEYHMGVLVNAEPVTKRGIEYAPFRDLATNIRDQKEFIVQITIVQRYEFQEWIKLNGQWGKKINTPVISTKELTNENVDYEPNGTIYYTI